MIKIALVEDHLVVRNGIKMLLQTQADLEIIAEADNGLSMIELLQQGISPDVILSDMDMPELDGFEMAKRIMELNSKAHIIILSMINDVQVIKQVIDIGVSSYLVKNIGYEELLFAIRHVASGNTYLSQDISFILLERYAKMLGQSTSFPSALIDMTERELEVLQLIGEGYTNMQIADKLFLSKRTVEGHRQNLIEKVGVKNSASLIKYAVKHNLIS